MMMMMIIIIIIIVKSSIIFFTIDCLMSDRKVIIPTVEGLHYYMMKKAMKTIMRVIIELPVNIQI